MKNILQSFDDLILDQSIINNHHNKHPKCGGTYDEWNGDYDCQYYTKLDCEDCKYGLGKKDPEAKCNQL